MALAPEQPQIAAGRPRRWVPATTVERLDVSGRLEVSLEGRRILLVRLPGGVVAYQAFCPHQGGPLVEGEMNGCALTCPIHHWSFDLRTGRRKISRWERWRDPSSQDVQLDRYPVRVEDGQVLVAMPEDDPEAAAF